MSDETTKDVIDAEIIEDGPQAAEAEVETPEPAAQEPAKTTQRSIVPMLLAGVIVAGGGFAGGFYLSQNLPQDSTAFDAMQTQISEQASRIAALENAPVPEMVTQADLNTLRTDIVNLRNTLTETETTLHTQMGDTLDSLSLIQQRIGEFERLLADMDRLIMNRTVASDQTVTEFREQVEALQAELVAVSTRLETEAHDAAARAVAAQASSILTRVNGAIASGEPFPDLLAELGQTHGIAVPDALAELAATGAPNIEELLETYPGFARAAIAASVRQEVEDGTISRFGGFMRTQFGARSLEPREGDDTDAILSRVEGALRNGDVSGSLAQLDSLSGDAAVIMSEWAVQLRLLDQASVAISELEATLRGE